MKISAESQYAKNLNQTEKSKGTKKAELDLKNSDEIKGEKKVSSQASDVKISDKAREFEKIKSLAKQAPEVRADKVAEFKELIKNGQYKVNSEKVAESLLNDQLLNEIASNRTNS